ncbi:MAG: allantoicase [Sandaracinaceae bacterium]
MTPTDGARFSSLINLAAGTLGARALATNDDFFASMHNLVKPGRGVFEPDRYTERGKWMDGWESRRKRGPGTDWCVLALGAPGRIRAVDIDTNHFLGNHPPFASFEAANTTDTDWESADWVELLAESPLRPGSQNLFTVADERAFTHVRLTLHPDGGVARLKIWGEVVPRWEAPELDEATRPHVGTEDRDLAAVVSGGKALACSDAFFGPMDNLLLPDRAVNMGGGWETRRKRPAPGNDWILVRLGAPGTVSALELDTNHFKGNFPDRCALRGIHAPDAKVTALIASEAWETILDETALAAHTRHFFTDALQARGPFTHVRLDVYPDGGISRMRVWGRP